MGLQNNQIRCVLWDWDGTLCLQSYFWPESRLFDPEIKKLGAIWKRPEASAGWLIGKENLTTLSQDFGCNLTYAELVNRLIKEWPDERTINKPLFSTVKRLFPEALHIIVTNNMDIFNDWAMTSQFIGENIDKIYNSFDYKTLKEDNPGLFVILKEDLGLSDFSQTILIDDNIKPCTRFSELGGQSILVDRNKRI